MAHPGRQGRQTIEQRSSGGVKDRQLMEDWPASWAIPRLRRDSQGYPREARDREWSRRGSGLVQTQSGGYLLSCKTFLPICLARRSRLIHRLSTSTSSFCCPRIPCDRLFRNFVKTLSVAVLTMDGASLLTTTGSNLRHHWHYPMYLLFISNNALANPISPSVPLSTCLSTLPAFLYNPVHKPKRQRLLRRHKMIPLQRALCTKPISFFPSAQLNALRRTHRNGPLREPCLHL